MTPCPGFGVTGFDSSGLARRVRTRVENMRGPDLTVTREISHSFLPLVASEEVLGSAGLETLSHPRRILQLKEIDRVGHSAFGYRTGERCGRCRPRILARVRSESFIVREIRRWAPSNTLGCFLLFEVIDSGDADP